MIGLAVRKSDGLVFAVIEDVTRITGNNIYGSGGSAEGIDLDIADIIVVDAEPGSIEKTDIVPDDIVDHKSQFIKQTPEEENAILKDRLAATESAILFLMDLA